MATQVVLERDGHDQAWGFRLQGGTDVGLPLSIQRVLVGTPSEAVLKRGDVITKVGPVSTTGLTHQQAADLISAAGNKIEITVKRAVSGAPKMPSSAQPSVSSLQASAAHRQQQLQQEQQQQQRRLVATLPRTKFVPKFKVRRFQPPAPAASKGLSVKNQPYRTLPLVEPSIKTKQQVGLENFSFLKIQENLIAGVKSPTKAPLSPIKFKPAKIQPRPLKFKSQSGAASSDQKSTWSPAAIPASGPIAGPVPVKLPPSASLPQTLSPQPAKYNSAAGLYANQSSGYLKKPAGTGMINPTKLHSTSGPPAPIVLNPGKDFNPSESETYKLLLESEAPPDLEKTRNFTSMNVHEPIHSQVYSAPKVSEGGQRPVRPGFPGTKAESPRVMGGVGSPARDGSPRVGTPDGTMSHVAVAALAEGSPASRGRSPRNEPVPLYETNSIGGRRRIAQSSSFNKLMNNVLGE